ncbi:beta-ketoacyl synthase N-terminal-like domain-containing protein [uncultured Clostridium sp.]|uniref:beta-ketoacyl synthase N-terminal-like domain-containing protein n=1 Tax=uncultured Clostridium sp. TaxID=59620 RepID=UPI0025CEFF63|nr:beta-ketoacyl synthase N-terminal-like domain-containing protein [uncultured Clostridium sp.]
MSNSVYISGIDVISTISNNYEEFKKQLFSYEFNESNKEKDMIDLVCIKRPYIKDVRRMNRASVLAYISSTQAFEGRGLDKISYDSYDIGTIFSVFSPSIDSSLSVLKSLYSKGIELVSPIMFSSTVGNSCIAGVAMKYKLKGESIMFKSENALNYSNVLLRQGRAEILLCGSYDVYTSEKLNYYKKQSYVAKESSNECHPYSDNPKGIKLKECGVTLILERENSKYLEDEKVFCEISNISIVRKTGNNEEAIKYFEKDNFKDCMNIAIKEAGINPKDIDAIISAAGEHISLDKAEEGAISDIFGKDVPVTTVKGIFGDSLGTNICLNTAVGATVIKEGKLPKAYGCNSNSTIININTECINKDFKYVLANGYSETGDIISIILKKVGGENYNE